MCLLTFHTRHLKQHIIKTLLLVLQLPLSRDCLPPDLQGWQQCITQIITARGMPDRQGSPFALCLDGIVVCMLDFTCTAPSHAVLLLSDCGSSPALTGICSTIILWACADYSSLQRLQALMQPHTQTELLQQQQKQELQHCAICIASAW